MKKLFCVICFLLCVAIASVAQEGGSYKNAIGGRFSSGYYDAFSASFKTFLNTQGAIELNLGIRPYTGNRDWVNVSFSAAYQHHFPIGNIEGFRWFIGGGLSAFNSFSNNKDYSGFGLGIFPTGGVDYKFPQIPLNVSADLRPTLLLVDPLDGIYKDYYQQFYAGNIGVAVRYTF